MSVCVCECASQFCLLKGPRSKDISTVASTLIPQKLVSNTISTKNNLRILGEIGDLRAEKG